MQFAHVPPAQMARHWPAIAKVLAPAVRQDIGMTMQGVFSRLQSGTDFMVRVSGEAKGFIVLDVLDNAVLETKYAAGRVSGGPKRRAAIIHAIFARIEQDARASGCTEHRICGRDWSFLLKDYEPYAGLRNGLRKVL